jgi:hypothetical protein
MFGSTVPLAISVAYTSDTLPAGSVIQFQVDFEQCQGSDTVNLASAFLTRNYIHMASRLKQQGMHMLTPEYV